MKHFAVGLPNLFKPLTKAPRKKWLESFRTTKNSAAMGKMGS